MKAIFAPFFFWWLACLLCSGQEPSIKGHWKDDAGREIAIIRNEESILQVVFENGLVLPSLQSSPTSIRASTTYTSDNVPAGFKTALRAALVGNRALFEGRLSPDGEQLKGRIKYFADAFELDGKRRESRWVESVFRRQSIRVKDVNLYADTPDGLLAVEKIVEDTPMVVEVVTRRPVRHPLEVTVMSGEQEIRLLASPVVHTEGAGARGEEEGSRNRFLRTDAFFPTFGRQLGVPAGPDMEDEIIEGREPSREEWKQLSGRWRTVYRDAILGNVTGWVSISRYGQVDLRYEHPLEKTWHDLELERALILEDGAPAPELAQPGAEPIPKWSFQFKGRGVVSDRVESSEYEAAQRLLLDSMNPAPLRLKVEGRVGEFYLVRRTLADRRKVRFELDRGGEGGILIWKWGYRADLGTGRDGEGFGRVGVLRIEDGGESSTGSMLGREAWAQQAPRITAAVCLDDQMGLDGDRQFNGQPVPEYRYSVRSRTVRMGDGSTFEDRLGRSGNPARRVFIVASNLPPSRAGELSLRPAEESGVEEYRIVGRGTEDDLGLSMDLRDAWERYRELTGGAGSEGDGRPNLEEDENPSALLAEGMEEGILALAILKSEAAPGYESFRLESSAGRWRLAYGDMVGKLSIVRKVGEGFAGEGDEWELVPTAVVPEPLRVSVKAEFALSGQETIEVALSIDGRVVEHGGKQKISLVPDPDEPGRYLSPTIELVRPSDEARARSQQPAAVIVPAERGDSLKVMASPDSGYVVQPLVVEAAITDSPEKMNALWKSAVKKAADAASKPLTDWNAVARGEAGAVSNFIITDYILNSPFTGIGAVRTTLEEITSVAERKGFTVPLANWWKREAGSRSSWRTIPISIGDHAAMLLLRDTFIEMMREQRRDWSANQAPAKLRSIYKAQSAAIGRKRSPLSFLKVPLNQIPSLNEREVDADEAPFLYAYFDDAYLRDELGVRDSAVVERLRWSAFNYAYRSWGNKMGEAITEATNIPVSDVRALLDLTGHSFSPVVARLLPRMMKLDADVGARRQRWVPDHVARAYVKGLYVLGTAVKAQEDMSRRDTAVALTTAALATIPLGNIGGFWAAMAAWGIAAVDVGYAVYTDVYQNWEREARLEDEAAMGAVLGYGRAAETEASIVKGWEQALSVGGSLLGLGADTASVVRAVRAARALRAGDALEEGARVLSKIDPSDPASMSRLSVEERAVLQRFLDDAAALVRQGAADELTEAQKLALRNRDQLAAVLNQLDEVAEIPVRVDEARRRILSNLPPSVRQRFADIEVEVLSRDEFARLTRSEAGTAVVLVENGKPRIVMREGASLRALDEEAVHLRQLADGAMARKFESLDEGRLRDWFDLEPARRFDLYGNKLDIEVDAQRRILRHLETAMEGADPSTRRALSRQMDDAKQTLDNLLRRGDEVSEHRRLVERGAMSVDEVQYLRQKPRLFSKPPTGGGRPSVLEQLATGSRNARMRAVHQAGNLQETTSRLEDLAMRRSLTRQELESIGIDVSALGPGALRRLAQNRLSGGTLARSESGLGTMSRTASPTQADSMSIASRRLADNGVELIETLGDGARNAPVAELARSWARGFLGFTIRRWPRDVTSAPEYFSKHAELQLAYAMTRRLKQFEPISVSKPMCAHCQAFFSRLAEKSKVAQVVSDTERTRVFYPNGRIQLFDKSRVFKGEQRINWLDFEEGAENFIRTLKGEP